MDWHGFRRRCTGALPDVVHHINWPYTVPARVFTSGFIKHLTLIGSRLIAPLDAIGSVNLTSLHSLFFYVASIDDGMLDKLLRGCPLLENLGLYSCRPEFIEINAPGLEDFEHYASDNIRTGEKEDVRLDQCPELKHLKLCSSSISQEWFQELIRKSVFLETLSIAVCTRFQRVQLSNPLLKELEITNCSGLVDIKIKAPQLSSFVYRSNQAILPQIRMSNCTSLSSCNAPLIRSFRELNADWFVELREFLMSCPFTCFSLWVYIWKGELRLAEPAIPPLPLKIDRLELDVMVPPSHQVVVLDRLLSVSHPTTLCVKPKSIEHNFLS